MTQKEFFNQITKDARNDTELLYYILCARGFLLDYDGSKIVVSSNAHKEDTEYLDSILKKYEIGFVECNSIKVCNTKNISNIFRLFDKTDPIVMEMSYEKNDWRRFKRYKFASKVPVSYLEAYIARYVKAISACGVNTITSCDGNHPRGKRLLIGGDDHPNIAWHKYICNSILPQDYRLYWDKECANIYFNEKDQFAIYYKLNRAAEYLYKNRVVIRDMKHNAMQLIDNRFLRTASNAEIIELFYHNLSELLSEVTLERLEEEKKRSELSCGNYKKSL